ncbi:23S rRNA (adenine(1618)-N(6))-methyltransferase RlmF [Solitalea sp. MAHUQ-68]|uniref:Ribosomal RNA large subunit methyltransferase F n=1 Tax=Solitalea agri TaxID=2953739 RepID=A0A9X2JCW5_9SPHI|nr:23S rRNA (adenine(1618)-N(6))-methyltransferase RlmF [Solitalea agri]MCO4293902.1 23S rRNA (adenine(1618)-N(6))-methyltransferase RlmF [Solitalea agri]
MQLKKDSVEKTNLHPRNKHRGRYNFRELINACPELSAFVSENQFGIESVDFANAGAVKMLNKALLKQFYKIDFWDIPAGYLCPPIPGRADYIHYLADLLAEANNGVVPQGETVKVLDIGTGANCIYPIIGTTEYRWNFVGSDIDLRSIQSAEKIIKANLYLQSKIELRLQKYSNQIFKGLIKSEDRFHLTLCNPPFHSSAAEATSGTNRKLSNLGKKQSHKPALNFGGQHNELWCEGGEFEFIRRMIDESAQLTKQCLWFTTLVSKSANLNGIYVLLKRAQIQEFKTVEMSQGNKVSRFVAWTFLTKEEQENWFL